MPSKVTGDEMNRPLDVGLTFEQQPCNIMQQYPRIWEFPRAEWQNIRCTLPLTDSPRSWKIMEGEVTAPKSSRNLVGCEGHATWVRPKGFSVFLPGHNGAAASPGSSARRTNHCMAQSSRTLPPEGSSSSRKCILSVRQMI